MDKGNVIYEKKILIRSEQVDLTRRLRMSELFRLMEEASIAHTEELGCTKEKTLDRGLLWVISRQEAEIDEMPAYDDEIIVRSWQGDMMHVIFPRFYELIRDGRCIVRGRAMWMLIDEETRDMVMPEDYDIFIPGRPGSDEMMLPAIIIPSGSGAAGTASETAAAGSSSEAAAAKANGISLQGSSKQEDADEGAKRCISLTTRFSQVDINGHMNNTRYFDIIDDAVWSSRIPGSSDCVEGSGSKAKISTVPGKVSANYISELRLGDEFTLEEFRSGDSIYYQGISKGKTAFKIRYDH